MGCQGNNISVLYSFVICVLTRSLLHRPRTQYEHSRIRPILCREFPLMRSKDRTRDCCPLVQCHVFHPKLCLCISRIGLADESPPGPRRFFPSPMALEWPLSYPGQCTVESGEGGVFSDPRLSGVCDRSHLFGVSFRSSCVFRVLPTRLGIPM